MIINIEELRRLHAATLTENTVTVANLGKYRWEIDPENWHVWIAHAHHHFPAILDEIERLRNALQEFADCDLNDSNCASLYIASRRIRALAKKALRNSQS